MAVRAADTPAVLEAHDGVPMAGAVSNPLTIRLDPATISFILEHGGAKVLLTDRAFSEVVRAALNRMENPPLIVDIDDTLAESGSLIGELDYEALLAEGDPAADTGEPGDEWQSIRENPGRVMEALGDRLVAALGTLAPDARQCLVLRLLEGFSYKEIAEMMEIPVGTVMSHVHRARIKLREQLAELAIENGLVKGVTS